MGGLSSLMPQLKNQLLAVIDAILDGLINGLGGDLIFASAAAAAPWVSWPIISSIIKFVIGRLTERVYGTIEPPVALSIIKFQTNEEKTAFDNSQKALAIARKVGDQDAINKAKLARNNAFDSAVTFDGA